LGHVRKISNCLHSSKHVILLNLHMPHTMFEIFPRLPKLHVKSLHSLFQRVYVYDMESSRVIAFVDGHDDDVNAVSTTLIAG
jgi:hypothetical protein